MVVSNARLSWTGIEATYVTFAEHALVSVVASVGLLVFPSGSHIMAEWIMVLDHRGKLGWLNSNNVLSLPTPC